MTLKPGVLAEVAEDLALLVSGMEGIRFKDMLEKLGHQLHDRDADLQSKNDLIMELQTKVIKFLKFFCSSLLLDFFHEGLRG